MDKQCFPLRQDLNALFITISTTTVTNTTTDIFIAY